MNHDPDPRPDEGPVEETEEAKARASGRVRPFASLVEHYHAIFEQAVKRGDVSVIGRVH